MIRNITRNICVAATAVIALTACSSGSNRYGMASEEGIAQMKEAIRAHVDTDVNKIYRLEWKEDGEKHKLENVLSVISVDYIDAESNDYSLTINLKDGKFVAGEPLKSKRNIYAYEASTPLDLDAITAAEVQRLAEEGVRLFEAQEESEQYELKSVEKFRYFILPADKRDADHAAQGKPEPASISFELNYIKKGEQPEQHGKYTWTNYYTIPFVVNKEGKVELE